MTNLDFLSLRCIHCRKQLVLQAGKYTCPACGAAFEMIDGKPLLLADKNFKRFREDLDAGFLNRLKTLLRKFSPLYTTLFYVLSPALFLGKSPRAILKMLPPKALVIDIGSGSKKAGPNVINVDIYPWANVDIIADAHDLPFLDNSLDGVITTWTIEHLKYPDKVISEIFRVLKPGGYLYLATNFIIPYHSSPHDYHRWTADGLRVLLEDFELLELEPNAGPTAALLLVIQEWVSLVLSFNSKLLKDFIWLIMVLVTFPLKLLDLIFISYKRAGDLAAGFYYIGRKPV